MKIKELKKLVAAIPKSQDNLNAWLGVDGGEGFTVLDSVFIGNCLHLPLDLDDASDLETDHVSSKRKLDAKLKQGFIASPGEELTGEEGDEVTIWGNALILGGYRVKEDYDSAKANYDNREEIAKREREEEKIRLAAYIKEMQEKLDKLKEEPK